MKIINYIALFILLIFTSCSKTPGNLTGNVFWKYNNFVGNRPDAGAKITLYALDEKQQQLKYDASADVAGNYKIGNVLPGEYLLVIESKNTTSSPKNHLDDLLIYSDEVKNIFGLDLKLYTEKIEEIKSIDSLYNYTIRDKYEKYGGIHNMILTYEKLEKDMEAKSSKLIQSIPDSIRLKINLFTGYDKSKFYKHIKIDEAKSINEVTDFGVTYM